MCSNWQQATARRRLDVEEIFSRHVATHDRVRGITPGIQPSMKCCSLRVKGGDAGSVPVPGIDASASVYSGDLRCHLANLAARRFPAIGPAPKGAFFDPVHWVSIEKIPPVGLHEPATRSFAPFINITRTGLP